LPYLRVWGVYPEDDRGKRHIRIEDVEWTAEVFARTLKA
jgi:hypothetical protein